MRDLVLVVAQQNQGWILDRICREIASLAPETSALHVWDGTVPPARTIFFSHFSIYADARSLDTVRRASCSVFFTHPPTVRRALLKHALAMRSADHVISMSSVHARVLRRYGLGDRVRVVVPGTDPNRFPGHRRGGGAVGFCSAFYDRKAPEKILDIVSAEQSEQFILLGRSWTEWERWPELAAKPNLEYVEAPYDEYPTHYGRMDVFVSPSRLEGGPIPLLEAMMSNVVPVATDTGFARDLIEDGENGLIVPSTCDAEAFVEAIARARSITTDVRATVRHRTWTRFSEEVLDIILPGQRL